MKKTFKNIIIFIMITFTIIFFKNQFSALLLTDAPYGMPALIKRHTVENLFLGSSMFRQGIDITELNTSFPNENYILSYNGNQPVTEYLELENLLNHNVKIKNLYVDMYVYSAWSEPTISDEKLLLETDFSQKMSLYHTIFPTMSLNSIQYLWELLITSNNELLLTWPLNSFILNHQFSDGGSLISTPSADPSALNNYTVPKIDSNMNPEQELYLNNLISLALDHNINIVFIETPKYSVIANSADYLNGMELYCALLEKRKISYIISDTTYDHISQNAMDHAKAYTFNTDNSNFFTDALHLSSLGKSQFTRDLLHLF